MDHCFLHTNLKIEKTTHVMVDISLSLRKCQADRSRESQAYCTECVANVHDLNRQSHDALTHVSFDDLDQGQITFKYHAVQTPRRVSKYKFNPIRQNPALPPYLSSAPIDGKTPGRSRS